jgi:hypothetical protein
MTEKNAEMARLLMAAEAVVEELDRQGLLEAVINLGFDPDQMAMAVIKAADRDVVLPRGHAFVGWVLAFISSVRSAGVRTAGYRRALTKPEPMLGVAPAWAPIRPTGRS